MSSRDAAGGGAEQDVGDVVHLEHVNLEVPDLDLARVFYAEGLGLTADPDTLGWQRGGPFVTWYNLGRQQLHICKGAAPQNTRGTIVLRLPSLARAAERLAALRPVLQDTAFSFSVQQQQQEPGQERQGDAAPAASRGDSITAADPWGQLFLLVESAPGFPFPAGIVELRLPCFPGTAHFIARFYSEQLGARVVECSGSGGGGESSRVLVGPGTCLRFEEDASLGELTPQGVEELWTGWHVAFYTTRFSAAFRQTLALGINQLDHPYRDKSPDLAAALANRQFRFKDVHHLDAFGKRGQLLYCLGHEVRSLHHPAYLRPLYNRRD